jgi:hypothetical protein
MRVCTNCPAKDRFYVSDDGLPLERMITLGPTVLQQGLPLELQILVLKAVLEIDRRLDESEVMDQIMRLPEYEGLSQVQAEGMKADLMKAVQAFDQQLAQSSSTAEVIKLPGAAGIIASAQACLHQLMR